MKITKITSLLHEWPKPENSIQVFCLGSKYCPYNTECHCNHMVSITNESWPECLRSVLTDIRSEFSFSQISKACSVWTLASFLTFLLTWKGYAARGRHKLVLGTSLGMDKIFSLWLQSNFQITLLSVAEFSRLLSTTVYPSIMTFNFCLKTWVRLFQDGLSTLLIDSIMLGLLN